MHALFIFLKLHRNFTTLKVKQQAIHEDNHVKGKGNKINSDAQNPTKKAQYF